MEPNDVNATFRTSKEAFGHSYSVEPEPDREWGRSLGIFVVMLLIVAAVVWCRAGQ